jgi:hypothetical protein
MFRKRIQIVFLTGVIFLMAAVSVAQATPPLQEPHDEGDETITVTDSLNLDDKGNNLGTIMSGRENDDEFGEELPDGEDPDGGEPDADDPDDDDATEDDSKDHPVASAIADYFDEKFGAKYSEEADAIVTYEDIKTLHDNGYGFGVITKAYFFAYNFDIELNELDDIMDGDIRGWRKVLNELTARKHGQEPQEPISVQSNSRGASSAEPPGQARKSAQAGPPGQISKGNAGQATFDFSGPGNGNGRNQNSRGNSSNAGGNGVGNGGNGRPDDQPGGGNNQGNSNGNSGGNGHGRGRNK